MVKTIATAFTAYLQKKSKKFLKGFVFIVYFPTYSLKAVLGFIATHSKA